MFIPPLIPLFEPKVGFGTMVGHGIRRLTHSPVGSGGLTGEDKLYVFAGGEVRLRSIVTGFNGSSDLIDINSPSRATLLLCSSGIRIMADQVMPWIGCSGVFLGSKSEPFSCISVSGLHIKPVDSIKPSQHGFRQYTTVEGDVWHRKAGELAGGGRHFFDTGSGITSIPQASGFYYGIFTTATSGVPTALGAVYGVIPWTQDTTNDRYFIHSPTNAGNNTHIYVKIAGWYEINYNVNAYKTSNTTNATADVKCVKNNTIILPGSQSAGGTITRGHGSNANWHGIVYLDAMDSISVHIRETTSSATDVIIVNNYQSLFIKYIGPGI